MRGDNGCLAACQASPAARVHVDGHPLAVRGNVADHLLVAAVADQAVGAARPALGGRVRGFGVDVIVVVGFLDPRYLVGGEVQDVGGHAVTSGR